VTGGTTRSAFGSIPPSAAPSPPPTSAISPTRAQTSPASAPSPSGRGPRRPLRQGGWTASGSARRGPTWSRPA
jgi:hypothetical protein